MVEFKDAQGRWITRGLILELNDYQDKYAVFTLDDSPKERDGRLLTPIKQLQLSIIPSPLSIVLGIMDHYPTLLLTYQIL